MTLLELTVSLNSATSLASVKPWKQNKLSYQLLMSDLSRSGFSVRFLTIEIGCLGHYTNDAYTALKETAPSSTKKARRDALKTAGKAAISGSYYIFAACNCTS